MYNVLTVIIMSLVTYIPRALPLAFFKKKIKSQFINSFLFYVPYAVLACLTFPGIFFFTSNIYLSIIGTSTALLLSLFKQKLFVVALVSVLVVFGFEYVFN